VGYLTGEVRVGSHGVDIAVRSIAVASNFTETFVAAAWTTSRLPQLLYCTPCLSIPATCPSTLNENLKLFFFVFLSRFISV